MKALFDQLIRLKRDQRGGAVVEYALIASLLVLGLIAAITSMGDTTEGWANAVDEGWGKGDGE